MKRYEVPEMKKIEFVTEDILEISSPVIDSNEKEKDSKVEIGTLPIDLF